MPLDTAVRGLLDAVKATGMPTIGSVSAQEMRAFQKAMLAKMPPGPDIFRTEELVIPSDAGGMAARLYWPSAAPRALIVYFHGGGWTIGSLDGWDGALRRLANTSGCAVLSVDYRLAPEAPFPAAVDDALTAVKWAGTNIAKLAGGDVPLIVAGDSAGGNLSAVTAQTIRDHGGPRIAAQILVYPSTDGDIDSERLSRFESPFLTREETSWFFDQYIPDRAQRTDVRFAPLRAKNLAKLPPAFVLSAENDILSAEAELYAERMREAGVEVKLERYLGTIHGFLTIDRGMLPHSAKAFADIDAFISSVLPVMSGAVDEKRQDAQAEFDPDALRERYRQERDKRVRPQKNAQWVEVEGEFRHYVDDPYVEPGLRRDAVHETVEVLVVGGGFGGLLTAAKLRQAGIESFRIVEKAGDFGGTWYWNRYPGAQCDIDAYIYMPLLEETGYMPTQKYADGPEILAHAQRIGRHFDLYRTALFQTQIKAMRWDDDASLWVVTTDRDDIISARFVVSSSGPLNRPKLPGIPGIGSFKGHTFHTSRWDYAYTGGDHRGGMHGLADKRVAVIGTGATGIQCIPYVGQTARQLYVFQRTPSLVDVRGNRPTDPEWVKTLKPGWQQQRMVNFNTLVGGGHQDEDLVHDCWTDMIRNHLGTSSVTRGSDVSPEEMARQLELADFRKGNQVRARIDSVVQDKQTADGLKAWYRTFCKRPAFNDEYLPTFNRPNVKLVDTGGLGVERITESALVVGGVAYEVDCIVFATGFEVGTDYSRRAGFPITGCGGKTLSQHHAGGTRTLHGFYSHGFPNFFHLGLSQNGYKANFVDMLGEQTDHLLQMIRHMRAHGLKRLEPTAEAEAQWVETIREKSKLLRVFLAQCTPGYYSGEGDLDRGLLVGTYGAIAGSLEFSRLLADWHADGQMRGLDLC